MRINKLNIKDIKFTYTSYSQSMYDSIKRIGLSFPIKVMFKENQYYCQDGHKRLSAINDLLGLEEYSNLKEVNVIILNDGSSRSNDCWNGRNTH